MTVILKAEVIKPTDKVYYSIINRIQSQEAKLNVRLYTK